MESVHMSLHHRVSSFLDCTYFIRIISGNISLLPWIPKLLICLEMKRLLIGIFIETCYSFYWNSMLMKQNHSLLNWNMQSNNVIIDLLKRQKKSILVHVVVFIGMEMSLCWYFSHRLLLELSWTVEQTVEWPVITFGAVSHISFIKMTTFLLECCGHRAFPRAITCISILR